MYYILKKCFQNVKDRHDDELAGVELAGNDLADATVEQPLCFGRAVAVVMNRPISSLVHRILRFVSKYHYLRQPKSLTVLSHNGRLCPSLWKKSFRFLTVVLAIDTMKYSAKLVVTL